MTKELRPLINWGDKFLEKTSRDVGLWQWAKPLHDILEDDNGIRQQTADRIIAGAVDKALADRNLQIADAEALATQFEAEDLLLIGAAKIASLTLHRLEHLRLGTSTVGNFAWARVTVTEPGVYAKHHRIGQRDPQYEQVEPGQMFEGRPTAINTCPPVGGLMALTERNGLGIMQKLYSHQIEGLVHPQTGAIRTSIEMFV